MSEENVYYGRRAEVIQTPPPESPAKPVETQAGNNSQEGNNGAASEPFYSGASADGYRVTTRSNQSYTIGDEGQTSMTPEPMPSMLNAEQVRASRPDQYIQMGTELTDRLRRDEGFKRYYQQLASDGTLEQLADIGGLPGVDQQFTDMMSQTFGVSTAELLAASKYYEGQLASAQDSPVQVETQEKTPTSTPEGEEAGGESVDIYPELMEYYETDEATVNRMIDATEAWFQTISNDEADHLLSIKDEGERFRIAYNRMRQDMKAQEREQQQRQQQRSKMPTFTQAEIDNMSQETYAKYADRILRAYQLGLVK